MIFPILTDSNPLLRTKSQPVKVFDKSLEITIYNLLETAKSGPNTVGLAAIQCGIDKRIILISEDGKNFKVLINPEILHSAGSQLSTESCLSVPGLTKTVTRPVEILCQFQNIHGNIDRLTTKGFLSAVLAHELAHTEGRLLLDEPGIGTVNKGYWNI